MPEQRQSSMLIRGSLVAISAFALAVGAAVCDSSNSNVARAAPADQTAQASPGRGDGDHNGEDPGDNGAIRLTEAEVEEAGILTEELKPQQMADELALTANITADQNRMAHVAPRVEGLLIGIAANLGDKVEKGQKLAVIDSIPMGEAQAEYRRTASELRLARTNFERAERLFSQKVTPQRQWQEARSAMERAQASFRAASDRLEMLGGLPDTGKPHFTLAAPFAGTVIEKGAVLGELAKTDKSLFTIADLSTVWIEADVLEKDVGKLAAGARATVTLPAYPGEVFTGEVTYVSSVLDRKTRTVKARVEAPNPEGKLRIDMYATVVVETRRSIDRLLSLPQSAVLLVQGRPTAYVLTRRGFEPRPVKTGETMKGRVVIASGLAEGEKVVTAGAFALKARQLKSTLGEGG
jgi:cobalt-zinc-cadmium efflux system membrane fusion protein